MASVAEVLRDGEPAVLFIGGDATGEQGLTAASRGADATGAKLLCETFPTRLTRGAGVPEVERLGYFAEAAVAQMQGAKHLVLAGARAPVSFFAYPDLPSDLVPDGCDVHVLADASSGRCGADRPRRSGCPRYRGGDGARPTTAAARGAAHRAEHRGSCRSGAAGRYDRGG